MLAFLLRACAVALERFPALNASVAGDVIVYKQYCHLGFAVDTDQGVVVPVLRDADRKTLRPLAKEAAELSSTARAGRLKIEQIQGGCFTISSLGSIGGTGFTPIINAPEVAILGVARSELKPKWDGMQFRPRLMLPLCLSWDHRAVDGAAAAGFLAHLAGLLRDVRQFSR
jgi:pyruvate dehydrogenase E2 component (dihydrolipoamide acetyltransferase)